MTFNLNDPVVTRDTGAILDALEWLDRRFPQQLKRSKHIDLYILALTGYPEDIIKKSAWLAVRKNNMRYYPDPMDMKDICEELLRARKTFWIANEQMTMYFGGSLDKQTLRGSEAHSIYDNTPWGRAFFADKLRSEPRYETIPDKFRDQDAEYAEGNSGFERDTLEDGNVDG